MPIWTTTEECTLDKSLFNRQRHSHACTQSGSRGKKEKTTSWLQHIDQLKITVQCVSVCARSANWLMGHLKAVYHRTLCKMLEAVKWEKINHDFIFSFFRVCARAFVCKMSDLSQLLVRVQDLHTDTHTTTYIINEWNVLNMFSIKCKLSMLVYVCVRIYFELRVTNEKRNIFVLNMFVD